MDSNLFDSLFSSESEENSENVQIMLIATASGVNSLCAFIVAIYTYYHGLQVLAFLSTVGGIGLGTCWLLSQTRFRALSKDVYCAFSALILFAASTIWPNVNNLVVFSFITCQTFLVFSLRKNQIRIMVYVLLNALASTTTQIFTIYPPPLITPVTDLSFVENFVMNFIMWVVSIIAFSGMLLLFNYLHLIADAKVIEKKQRQRDILDSIDQGLFTVGKDLRFGSVYSRKMGGILQETSLANLSFKEDFLDKAKLSQNLRKQILDCVDLIGQKDSRLGSGKELFKIKFPYEEKILEMKSAPIVKNDVVDKIMFTLKDITSSELLEDEKRRQAEELSIIHSFLNARSEDPREFLQSAAKEVEEYCNKVPSNALAMKLLEKLAKGSAKYQLEHVSHAISDIIHTLSTGSMQPDEVKASLQHLYEELNKHAAIINKYIYKLAAVR